MPTHHRTPTTNRRALASGTPDLYRLDQLAHILKLGRLGEFDELLQKARRARGYAVEAASHATLAVALADHRRRELVAWLPTAMEKVAVSVPTSDMPDYEIAAREDLPSALLETLHADSEAASVADIWRLGRARCVGELLGRVAAYRSMAHLPADLQPDGGNLSAAADALGTLFTLHLAEDVAGAIDAATCARIVAEELARRAEAAKACPF